MNKKKPSFSFLDKTMESFSFWKKLLVLFLLALLWAFFAPIAKEYNINYKVHIFAANFVQTLPAELIKSEVHVMVAEFLVTFAILFAFLFVLLLVVSLWQWANGDKKNDRE